MGNIVTEKDRYLEDFKVLEKRLNGQSNSQIHEIRQKAIHRFLELGFPTRRQEAWRFTNIEPVKQIQFKHPFQEVKITPEEIEEYTFDGIENRLVFINGRFSPALSHITSMPENIIVTSLSDAIRNHPELVEQHLAQYVKTDDNAFAALNTAFIADGAFIFVPQNLVVDVPIHLLYIADALDESIVSHPRNLLVIGANSQATIVESYAKKEEGVYFTNPVTEIVLNENAVLEHYKIEEESEKAFHIAVQNVEQKRDSHYVSHNYSFGGSIVRNDIRVVLDGEGAESVLNGLYMLWNDQHCDNHTLIEHVQPHCQSRELYKGILDDKSRAVFNGKILVHNGAQKTDAIQANKNLLLSENAKVDTQPQLEIYADDVKCTHGGTVGQLDEDGVFYLRSRGIGEPEARKMIIHSFVGQVLQQMKLDQIREKLDALVLEGLNKRFGHNEKN